MSYTASISTISHLVDAFLFTNNIVESGENALQCMSMSATKMYQGAVMKIRSVLLWSM